MNVDTTRYDQLSPALRLFFPRRSGAGYANVETRGKDRDRWAVTVTIAGERMRLGTYKDEKVAGVVAQAAKVDLRLIRGAHRARWLRDMRSDAHARTWLAELGVAQEARDMALAFGAKAEGAAHLHAATSTVAPDT